MTTADVFVGLDVSQAALDVAVWPATQAPWRVTYDEDGLATLIAQLQALRPTLIVLEATGGLEARVVSALALADLPTAVVNPRQVRAFAKATGRLAKTDRLDAQVNAHYGAAVRPTPRALPEQTKRELAALVTRRQQLVALHTAEGQRLARAPEILQASHRALMQALATQITDLDRDLQQRIKASPLWQAQAKILQSVPGVGRTTAQTLLAQLPELGQLSARAISLLVGVAPLNDDSGKRAGLRHIWGGRAPVRTALYMATMVATRRNPVIRAYYQRLRAAGKAPKVARIAAMHKLLHILNAMLKHNRPWQAVEA